jgi:hypothetical protein
MMVSGLPEELQYTSALQRPYHAPLASPSMDYFVTTDRTLTASPASLGLPDPYGHPEHLVRLLDGHDLRSYLAKMREGLCWVTAERRRELRARFLEDPARHHLYLAVLDHPHQVNADFEEAVASVVRRDKAGAVVLAIRQPRLAWAGLRGRLHQALGPDDATRLYLEPAEAYDLDELIAAADVLIDPFPFGGSLEIIGKALQACGTGVVPVISLPPAQIHARPAQAVYQALFEEEMMNAIDPLARNVDDLVDKALAFAQPKGHHRRRLLAFMKRVWATLLPYEDGLYEERLEKAIASDLAVFLKTARRSIVEMGAAFVAS